MAKNISGRKVRLFRCQIPPLIGPKILNAHIPKDLGWEAEVDATTTGVVITLANGNEHFVPFTNIQNTELYPLEQSGPVEIMQEPKRIGRPPKSGAI